MLRKEFRNDPMVMWALEEANRAHAGQTRKYTEEPYIVHPITVATTVHQTMQGGHYSAVSETVAAALLHDVVEDCGVPLTRIEQNTSPLVAELVFWLTDFPTHHHGNRETRSRLSAVKMRGAPRLAQMVKIADIMDNCSSIVNHDPNFAVVYCKEKKRQLEYIRESWAYSVFPPHSSLFQLMDRAMNQVTRIANSNSLRH